jgi:hypothetical protein
MSKANVFEDACEYDDSDPDGYLSAVAHVGKAAGGEALAVKLFEVTRAQFQPSKAILAARGELERYVTSVTVADPELWQKGFAARREACLRVGADCVR